MDGEKKGCSLGTARELWDQIPEEGTVVVRFDYPVSFYGKFVYESHGFIDDIAEWGVLYSGRKPLKHMEVHYNAVLAPKKKKQARRQRLTWRTISRPEWNDGYTLYGQFEEHLQKHEITELNRYWMRVGRRRVGKRNTYAWAKQILQNLGYRVVA